MLLACLPANLFSVERFPPPDFEQTNHQLPSTDYITKITPRIASWQYIDIIVLTTALAISAYTVLKKRTRSATFTVMVFSMLYFGFWRKGCVCSIGAIQNVTLSIFDNNYVLPLVVLLFFILPLLASLFFGRVFCGSVCPLGAMQDFVLLRPLRIPHWLENFLRLFAYLYLCSAIFFAAKGTMFIICRYDPFVSFYRFSGSLPIIITGVCVLLISVFIGRPYCRFLCPYGIILRHLSRLSRWKVNICDDKCIKCGLCERTCPYNAILPPKTSQNEYSVDPASCIACGRCYQACPKQKKLRTSNNAN